MTQRNPVNPEAKVLSHKEIYRGIVVGLDVDTIQLPSGRTAIREIVHHPGGVVAIPVLGDGRLVLIRQFRYPLQKYILELPAGKLDMDLTPLETVAREIEEETGYRAGTITHEISFCTSPGIIDEVIHLFIARDLEPTPHSREEGEHISVEAYSLEDCLNMVRSGEIADAKTIVGILWFRLKLETY
ncbi:MAG: NUDIX hydrolase [Acidobacteria bacterium]|nr:NUDIX hydrolase [Acidobacteriota bacterium]